MANFTPLATRVLNAYRARGWRLATAESCTGGMVAAAITAIAGSSDVFDSGFVTYSNGAKQRMLGVEPETLHQFGAVSEPVALQMAEGARARAGVDLAVSITGIAGPGGSDFKPEGRVCFGLSQAGSAPRAQTCEFGAIGRQQVRAAATVFALELLARAAEA